MRGLIDTTLREGGQTVGVDFSLAEKISIIEHLLAVGIEEIELGVAAVLDGSLRPLVRAARSLTAAKPAPRPRLALWCRCREEDIRYAAGLGPDVLSLSIPASDLHIREKLGSDREGVRGLLIRAVELARSCSIPVVSVGFEDSTRAEIRFLEELTQLARRGGAGRVRLADTVGICTPARLAELVRRLRKAAAVEVAVHTHNDFGMATANAIAALEAGADWADVTVLGLGERAGNARLEEVAGWLALAPNRENGAAAYDAARLKALCRTVAAASGREIAGHHPVVGEKIFTCESGLHLQGLYRNPATYEPYGPEAVGGERCLLLGGKAGRQAVRERFARLGISLSRTGLETMAIRVRELSRRCRRPLNDSDLAALAVEAKP